ncbi:MAG: hypothetical protein IPL46_33560 [Saprospiraceae bacterium]|nr:hypothetical protein [Saprospiraceae bacterium]
MLNSSIDVKPQTFTRIASHSLSANQLKQVKNAQIGKISLQGSRMTLKKEFNFYLTRNTLGADVLFILNNAPGKKPSDQFTVTSLPFSIISEGTIMVYCSCGMNLVDIIGDYCQHYQTSSGISCGGACEGDNKGKSCSVTSFNTETGEIAEGQGI